MLVNDSGTRQGHQHGTPFGKSPLAQEAWDAVAKFSRETVPGWMVSRNTASLINATVGKTWCACGPVEWNILLNKFGGGA